MPLNLPNEIWVMLLGAGAFFIAPIILLYIAYRLLRSQLEAKKRRYDE